MLTSLKRIVRSGFINFWRNGVVSLASVTVLTVTLFVIGWLFLGQAFLNFSLEEIKKRVDVSVSFQPQASVEEVLTIKEQLEFRPAVVEVIYRSPEEELADFRKRNKDNELILRSLDEVGNPFGARLNIRATDPIYYEAITQFLEAESDLLVPGGGNLIYEINYKPDNIAKLNSYLTSARRLASAVALILIAISVLTVFSTISLAIHVSREEISVMRLVGAGNAYIRGPFIVESMVAGLLASLSALLLLYPSAIWASGAAGFNFLNYYLSHFSELFGLVLFFGLGVSAAAGFWAVRKYLKV